MSDIVERARAQLAYYKSSYAVERGHVTDEPEIIGGLIAETERLRAEVADHREWAESVFDDPDRKAWKELLERNERLRGILARIVADETPQGILSTEAYEQLMDEARRSGWISTSTRRR